MPVMDAERLLRQLDPRGVVPKSAPDPLDLLRRAAELLEDFSRGVTIASYSPADPVEELLADIRKALS